MKTPHASAIPARIRRWALVGVAMSSLTVWIESWLAADFWYEPFINWPGFLNCSTALLSPWATVAGIPVAFIGGLWFALTGLLATNAFVQVDPSLRAIRWSGTIAIAVGFHLSLVAALQLHVFCLLCVGIFAPAVAIFVLAQLHPGTAVSTTLERSPRLLSLRTTLLLLFALGAWFSIAMFPKDEPPRLENVDGNPPAEAVPVRGPDPTDARGSGR
jgi:uncharacterized membrane protein